MSHAARPHARHTVLVVDDEAGIADILRELLVAEGLAVLVAHDGADAMALVQREVPCLALLDVMMPVMDGLALCRLLREDPRTAAMPIILVSARVQPVDVAAGIAAGADDYIKKPFDLAEVRFRVHAHLRLHEGQLDRQRLRDRLSLISRAAMDAIILLDASGAVAHWNEAAEAMFGYTPAEALGRNLHELVMPAKYRTAQEAAYGHFAATGQGPVIDQTTELTALRRSGEEFPVDVSLGGAKVDGAWWAVGIVRDITRRKHAEERFQVLYEGSHEAIMTTAPPWTRFTAGNPAAVALFGCRDEADLVSRGPSDYSPPSQPDGRPSAEAAREHMEEAMQAGLASFDWTHRTLDGTDFPAHVRLSRLSLGGQPCLLATVRDVTAERLFEMELGQARKLQAVGQLAAGVAHEINNPCQYISDSLHALHDAFGSVSQLLPLYRRASARLDPADALGARITELEADLGLDSALSQAPIALELGMEGLARVTGVVRGMGDFAQPGQCDKQLADLNQALANTLRIALRGYQGIADVVTDFGSIPLVACRLGDLNLVFLSLIDNAAHAIKDFVDGRDGRGTITVRTRVIANDVEVAITDTGSGIAEANRHRIFEPFFTTRPPGQGAGQGLAIARSIIVDRHGGTLSFHRVDGGGTTFAIRLPIGSGADAAQAAGAA